MNRILLISGDVIAREDTLRRRLLRFTGSRRATRAVMARIESARRLGQVMTCMVVPLRSSSDDDTSWDVRVSYSASRSVPTSSAL